MNHLRLLMPPSSTGALVVLCIVVAHAPLALAQEESAGASAADGSAEDGQPRVRVEERTDVDGQRRSGFYSEGARVQFLVGADGAWSVSRESPAMRATFTLRQDQRSQAAPSVVEGGLARQAGSISEWWLETSRGIEHVMNVDAKGAAREITVTIEVDGLVAVLADEQAVSLVDGDGAEQLRYSGLYVWDLFHRRQTAWFDVTDSGIAIHIEPDADALGPFTIDPLVSTPTSTLALASGDWGRAVATADFDGDTFMDLLVGQPDYASGQTGEGRANIVWGTASGPAFPLGTPFEPNVVNAGCGRAVAAADVDDDTDIDVLVGCAGAGLNGGRGGILVFRNSGSGAFPGYPSSPDLTFFDSTSTFTTELAIVADDIDGDGASEIFASARQDGSGNRPALLMFRYASGAQPAQPAVLLNAAATSTRVALAAMRLVFPERAIASAFDVSAGNRTIIAIDDSGVGGTVVFKTSAAHGLVVGQRIAISGANSGGATYNGTYTVAEVFSTTEVRTGEADPGSDNDPFVTSGTMTPYAAAQIQIFRLDGATGLLKILPGDVLKVPPTPLAFNSTSFSVTLAAGDTDGDTVSDLMLGLPLQGNTMRLFESVGGANNWAASLSMTGAGGRLGTMLLSADFNNDRHADGLVCDSLESSSRGRCRVFGGSPVGLNPFMERFTKLSGGTGFTGATGEGVGQMFAYSAAADLYKDSAVDVVLARPTVHATSMFDGDASSLKATDFNVIPGAAGADLGGDSFAVADINQDGIDDLVVGVVSFNRIEIYKGTSPGTPMSTQPDWVITSATTGQFGRAVAVGRFRGPATPPSIAVSDPEFSASVSIATVTDGAGAGGPVDVTTTSAHGFVPGDFITIAGANVGGATYNNVNYTVNQVLSATRFVTTQTDPGGDDDPTVTNAGTVTSSGNGRVWIFNAPTNGLPTATTTAGASDHISADTTGVGMGLALANCGKLVDTLGDCLAVGHKADDVGGAVSVWSSSGGSGGLNNTATAARMGAITGHDTVCGSSFGAFLANAGVADNSDALGRDDLLVGAPTCGTNSEGKAYLYSFSSTYGPVLVLKWNFEVNQDGARLGPVAGLGDVTGDGIADFAVGAPFMDNYNYNPVVVDAGRVYVFKGASSTPSTTQVTSMSTSFSSHCGTSIAGGVDINRDGFKDMIVGEPSYDNGLTDQGRVRVFFGKPGTMDIVPARNGTITGGGAGYAMGTAVAVGNLDGRADGSDSGGDIYGDVIIGVPGFSSGGKVVIRVGEW